MSHYRKIHVKVWGDEKFRTLSGPRPNAQTLWFFLLTGPQTGIIPGVSAAGEAALAETLGWTLQAFRRAFNEIKTQGMALADWESRLVFLPRATVYNPPESPNVVKAWRKAFDELPECTLRSQAYEHIGTFLRNFREDFWEPFSKPLAKASAKAMPNQEQEQEQENRSRKKERAQKARSVVGQAADPPSLSVPDCEASPQTPPHDPPLHHRLVPLLDLYRRMLNAESFSLSDEEQGEILHEIEQTSRLEGEVGYNNRFITALLRAQKNGNLSTVGRGKEQFLATALLCGASARQS
jgi:hypothetical protein